MDTDPLPNLCAFYLTGPMVGMQGVPGSKLGQDIKTFLSPLFIHSFYLTSLSQRNQA